VAINPARLNLASDLEKNVISSEVEPGFAFLASTFYDFIFRAMPHPSDSFEWGRVNFELVDGLIALPSAGVLKQCEKGVEVREIRGRGGVKRSYAGPAGPSSSSNNTSLMKLGIFALGDLDPGVLVLEYTGHVQTALNLKKPSNIGHHHSHILPIPHLTPRILVDARKRGSPARHLRRSCRPNCHLKLVLTSCKPSGVHLCVFTRNALLDGDELLLPHDDDQDSSSGGQYECACGSAELCLAPEGLQAVVPKSSSRVPSSASFDSAYLPEPRSHQVTREPQQPRAKTPSSSTTHHAVPLVSALAAAGVPAPPAPKMSREQRKFQQYIEQIDRMDHQQHHHQHQPKAKGAASSRKSSSGMASSVSNLATAAASSESSPARGSPKRSPEAGERGLSPRKQQEGVQDAEMASPNDDDEETASFASVELVKPKKAPKPLKEAKTQKIPKEQKAPKEPKSKKVKSPLDETDAPIKKYKKTDDRITKKIASEEQPMPARSSPLSRDDRMRLFDEGEESQHVDVVRPDEHQHYQQRQIDSSTPISAPSATPPPRPSSTATTNSTVETRSEQETPSKKRVSLSDYIRKRRNTTTTGGGEGDGLASREEGELPVHAEEIEVQEERRETGERMEKTEMAGHRHYVQERPLQPVTHAYTERRHTTTEFLPPVHQHQHHPQPSRPSARSLYGSMPPHLTPPPPLAAAEAEVLPPIPSESVHSSTAYYPPRYQSGDLRGTELRTGERAYQHPERSRKDYPQHHHQEHQRYAARERSYPSTSYDYSPTETVIPPPQQPEVYRPRPSLLKAAQDLPTRWEESTNPARPDAYRSDPPLPQLYRTPSVEAYGSARPRDHSVEEQRRGAYSPYDHRGYYPDDPQTPPGPHGGVDPRSKQQHGWKRPPHHGQPPPGGAPPPPSSRYPPARRQ